MMNEKSSSRIVVASVLLLASACGHRATGAPQAPPVVPAQTDHGEKVVQLCDGKTTTVLPGDAPNTRETGIKVAADLMAQWSARNPSRGWESDPDPAHAIVRGADNRGLIADADAQANQAAGHAYGNVTSEEVLVWEREVGRQVSEGDRVFHDGEALGSTISVSCDMCHPNAANTHPETYPKYQVQLGRVALLRDMINWCLQHPVRAQPMAADDPRMRAMESYIYAQRRGTPLNYGRR